MITIKKDNEIAILMEGGEILARIMDEIGNMIKPGVSTEDLENLACRLISEANGRPAFKHLPMPHNISYPSALCTSINEEVVHAPALPGRILQNGDIITVDVGMEYPFEGDQRGMYTDMARTFLVGEVKPEVKKLVQITKESLELGIKQVKPGNDLNDIGRAIQQHVEKHGFSVVREMVGHGVGYSVHEEPQIPHYEVLDNSMDIVTLKEGMVIAIEPMVNMGGWRIKEMKDGLTFSTADGSLSAQFEHTLVVTKDGCKVITK